MSDSDGTLYGTTLGGGSTTCNCGTVFKLIPPVAGSSAWTEQILHVFQGGTDGALPWAGVTLDHKGNIFGTTSQGGPFDYGTVYELSPSGGGYAYGVVHDFTGRPDGLFPMTAVIRIGSDSLVGATQSGGQYGLGLIYELTPPATAGGAWTESALYSFRGGSDGAGPVAMMRDRAGAFYGTTQAGGDAHTCAGGCGTVFQLARPGGGPWTETVVHSFATNRDAESGVVEGADGTLYGAVEFGGGQPGCYYASGCGRIYSLAPPAAAGAPWTLHTIYRFTDADGVNPVGGLLLDRKGILYGTTSLGAPDLGGGSIFKLLPPGPNHPNRWLERTPFSTNRQPGYDIRDIESALVQGQDGALYGTAQGGAPSPEVPAPAGVVFRFGP